jgi:MFS transporter, CP family, cyanate transporter
MSRRDAFAKLMLLWLVGLNLRLSVLALPPVLPMIRRDLNLSEASVAALAGLPLLLFGVGALGGALLISRIGARRALITGLVVIGVSSAARGVGPSMIVLFGATVGMGAAIAVAQPALPALVRQWFPHGVARATGVWSNGLLFGTIVSASLTLPIVLPLVGDSWSWSLLIWALPALVAAALLVPVRAESAPLSRGRRAWLPDWRSPRLWQLGLVQSAGTLGFFGASTFIPDYLHATGRADLVAAALAGLSLGQLPGSVLIAVLPWRRVAQRGTAVLVGGGMVWALLALLVAPGPLFVFAAAVLGACSGAGLVIALALPPLTTSADDVPRVAAGALGIGYSVVWLVLLVAGAAWDSLHVPAAAFLPAALGATFLLLLAPRLLAASAHPLAIVTPLPTVRSGAVHDTAA